MDRVRGRLGTLTPEQEMAIETLTRGIINKIMHTPITTLKSAARDRDAESTTVVDVVRKLFNLRSEAAGARPGSAEGAPVERRVGDRRAADRGTAERRSEATPAAPGSSDSPVPPLIANQSRK
jgi:glutamyl-tRNAGlu reductase-like protein